jgi:DNA modification methylase
VSPVSYLETSVLYCDDNLHRLSQFPAECIDLIYLDPPFFSNRTYEVIWGDEAEVRSFEDRWEGGVNHYVEWMRERMMEMRRVLKPTGSLWLHCDTAASHYLKVMMDDVFGMGNFRNEIIWKRTTAHNDSKRAGRIHDTILFYSRGETYTWNDVYQPLDPDYVERYYRYREPNGRRFMSADLTGAGSGPPRNFGERGTMDPPRGRHWMYDQAGIDRALKENRIFWTRNGIPRLKRYLDETPGMRLQDIWVDREVQLVVSWSAEGLGYPTQKPVALLERIVKASSNPGDIVLDPFCGCGTTIAAAHRLNRQWIGIDISPTAVNLMKRRVEREGASLVKLVGMPVNEAQLRALKPFEFQNWVIQRFNGTHSPRRSGDMGIDGYSFLEHLPIQVKQSERVGRPVVDNFETAMERDGKDKGYIVAFSFTRGASEEVARVKNAKGLEIGLVKVADLLEDSAELVTPETGQLLPDAPLPKAPPKAARPSARELVESDRATKNEAI